MRHALKIGFLLTCVPLFAHAQKGGGDLDGLVPMAAGAQVGWSLVSGYVVALVGTRLTPPDDGRVNLVAGLQAGLAFAPVLVYVAPALFDEAHPSYRLPTLGIMVATLAVAAGTFFFRQWWMDTAVREDRVGPVYTGTAAAAFVDCVGVAALVLGTMAFGGHR